MKNQYFGDRNDFFKFDLSLHILESLPNLGGFTFIPMLTADDASTDGSFIEYPIDARRDLGRFLREGSRHEERGIHLLDEFMQDRGFDFRVHGRTADFSHEQRAHYFKSIPDAWLQRSLVLIDPDNGLEVKSMARATGHKFLLYQELKDIVSRARDSTIVVYQHVPRVERAAYMAGIAGRIEKEMGRLVAAAVSDGRICFFAIVTGNASAGLAASIRTYARTRGCLLHDPRGTDRAGGACRASGRGLDSFG